ncbi:hypothetical protein AcV5_003383 [Taiwanofungus camphoratus]|nr:hypothetical protein AcV5_003383 [Antrodia cinnamomea]
MDGGSHQTENGGGHPKNTRFLDACSQTSHDGQRRVLQKTSHGPCTHWRVQAPGGKCGWLPGLSRLPGRGVPRSQQHNVKWGGGAKETGECCHPISPRATRRVTCTPVAPCNALTRPPVGARTLRPDQRRAGVREDAGAAAYESRSGSAARTWHAQRTRLRGPPAKQDRMHDRTTERQNGALLGTGDASTATNRGPMKP